MAGRGRPKGSKKNPFADMLRISVAEAHGDKAKLRVIADKLVESAVQGDIQAIKEVADRLDGKPAQAVQHGGESGGDIIIRMVSDDEQL